MGQLEREKETEEREEEWTRILSLLLNQEKSELITALTTPPPQKPFHKAPIQLPPKLQKHQKNNTQLLQNPIKLGIRADEKYLLTITTDGDIITPTSQPID
jgi:hypothetical protein